MTLVGYVSNERYEALSNVHVDISKNGQLYDSVRTTAQGEIRADVEPGNYQITLQKSGYAGKQSEVDVESDGAPTQFRLLSTDRLLGYAWPKWTVSGEEVEYRIHASEDVRVSLWRYGYEKERDRLIGWHHPESGPWPGVQQTPNGDYTQTGVDWTDVGPDHVPSPTIRAPERSGLYFFHLRGKESDNFFAFPLIVAPETPAASIAVLASANTWNAYNDFGGRSNYVNAVGLPSRPVANARQKLDANQDDRWRYDSDEYDPLSFDRPYPANYVDEDTSITDPVEGSEESHISPAEWRFLGWLERHKYSYDLYADYQLHTGQLNLNAYDVLVIQTHPEYWSEKMYRRVKQWIENGGTLMSLGGNGINCAVEFLDESRFRVLNAASDSDPAVRNPDEPRPVDWGTDKYESRFHKTIESEGNLLGSVTTHAGLMTAAPYEVQDDSHWIFEQTDLEDGDLFGTKSLQERIPGGASGHETDKLSRFAPDSTVLLAKGVNKDDGGAEITYYETESGGRVFSVGSITYPMSLLVDEATSTMTRTVIDRFVQ